MQFQVVRIYRHHGLLNSDMHTYLNVPVPCFKNFSDGATVFPAGRWFQTNEKGMSMFHQLLYMVTGTCDYLWYQGESNLKTFYLTGFLVKIFQHWVTIMVIISGKLRCSFCIFSSCYTKLLFHRSSLVFVCK